jgi:hypothetical protein
LWKLTPAQLANTVNALLPGSTLSVEALENTIPHGGHGFSNVAERLVLSAPHVKELTKLADEFAEHTVSERVGFASCLEAGEADALCVTSFLEDFLPRAFRRPIEPAETVRYAEFFEQESESASALDAFRQVVRGVFLSPNFQFRTELGQAVAGTFQMTPHERAAVLSYSVSDGPPDAALQAAADDGALATREQVAEQVRRLTSAPESAAGVTRFLREHFGVREVLSADKDANLFPEWGPELVGELAEESDAFFEEVLWRDEARLSTLLTADYSMVSDTLAPLYGLDARGSQGLERVLLPSGQRSGILSQSAFLAPLGGFEEADITRRGHFVRAVLMCQELPPPPANVPPIPEAEGLSRRERLATIHTEDPVCEACHALMDPIGYAFENYDAIGRWRTTEVVDEVTIAVNASGTIVGTSRGDVPVQNVVELGQTLAELPEVQACFVERLAEYLAGGGHQSDGCRVERAVEVFESTNGAILEGVVTLLSDEEYYLRAE